MNWSSFIPTKRRSFPYLQNRNPANLSSIWRFLLTQFCLCLHIRRYFLYSSCDFDMIFTSFPISQPQHIVVWSDKTPWFYPTPPQHIVVYSFSIASIIIQVTATAPDKQSITTAPQIKSAINVPASTLDITLILHSFLVSKIRVNFT